MSVIDFVKPGQSISLTCNLLFACETITADARKLTIKADSIYVGNVCDPRITHQMSQELE